MPKENKTLVILTNEFPYGKGETFLEKEISFLLQSFQKVIVLTESSRGQSRINTCDVKIHKLQKFNLSHRFLALMSVRFFQELNLLIKSKKLNINTFRTSWYSLSKAISYKKKLKNIHIKNKSSEIVYYSYWLDEKALALCLIKKMFSTINVISRTHGWDLYEDRHPNHYLPFRSFLLKTLDQVFTISNHGKEYLNLQYPHNINKTEVSRLGTLALDKLSKKKRSSEFQILSISNVISLKRVHKILELVSSIPNKYIHWTHIGDGPLMESIQKIAIDKSKSNLLFSFDLLGQQSNDEVRGFLSRTYIDIFINLSETEGIPVSIMEAQSAGIPVLATNVGGTSEIVNNENGFLVDKESKLDDIISVLHNYLKGSNEDIQRKRHASYINWEQNYNAERNYNQFIKQLTNHHTHPRLIKS